LFYLNNVTAGGVIPAISERREIVKECCPRLLHLLFGLFLSDGFKRKMNTASNKVGQSSFRDQGIHQAVPCCAYRGAVLYERQGGNMLTPFAVEAALLSEAGVCTKAVKDIQSGSGRSASRDIGTAILAAAIKEYDTSGLARFEAVANSDTEVNTVDFDNHAMKVFLKHMTVGGTFLHLVHTLTVMCLRNTFMAWLSKSTVLTSVSEFATAS
jgi:hypothetical protein